MIKKYSIQIAISRIILCIIFISFTLTNVYGWGFWGHRKASGAAILILPPEMQVFYKKYAGFITEHSGDPDKRRNIDKQEGVRHYLDWDYVCKASDCNVPTNWKDALVLYGQDSLNHMGIEPWYAQQVLLELTDAFTKKDKWEILRLSIDLSHYVADANVPLHASSNYNGQKTHQVGIHAFWESAVPEQQGASYNLNVQRAVYIADPAKFMFDIIKTSAEEVDSVLKAERTISARYDSSARFELAQQKDGNTRRIYTHAYTAAYQKELNNMQERKLRSSIFDIGSLWYTAWVNAGKPDLTSIPDTPMPAEYKALLNKMNDAWNNYK